MILEHWFKLLFSSVDFILEIRGSGKDETENDKPYDAYCHHTSKSSKAGTDGGKNCEEGVWKSLEANPQKGIIKIRVN